MRIWTVANQKGGVGKTTTSVALGGIAAEQGERVLFVDLDPHGSLSTYFGYNPDEGKDCAFRLFADPKNVTLEMVAPLVMPTQFKTISLLPATTAMATLERKAIGKEGMGLVISRALAHLAEDFDLAIIDTPPVLGVLLINALAACERLIIPVQTEFLALKGLDRMMHTLRMLENSQHKDLQYVIVPTMHDKRTQASVSTLRDMRHKYGTETWPGKIPVDTKFRDASKQGVPPNMFAPASHGIEAYGSLSAWLEKTYSDHQKTRFWNAS